MPESEDTARGMALIVQRGYNTSRVINAAEHRRELGVNLGQLQLDAAPFAGPVVFRKSRARSEWHSVEERGKTAPWEDGDVFAVFGQVTAIDQPGTGCFNPSSQPCRAPPDRVLHNRGDWSPRGVLGSSPSSLRQFALDCTVKLFRE